MYQVPGIILSYVGTYTAASSAIVPLLFADVHFPNAHEYTDCVLMS